MLFFSVTQSRCSTFSFSFSFFHSHKQASRASSELDEAYAIVQSWIDEVRVLKKSMIEGRIGRISRALACFSFFDDLNNDKRQQQQQKQYLASEDPAAASLARSQAALAFEATRMAMEQAEGEEGEEGRRREGRSHPYSSPSVLAVLEDAVADGAAAAGAVLIPEEEEEESSSSEEEGIWLRATRRSDSSEKAAAGEEEGSGRNATTATASSAAAAAAPVAPPVAASSSSAPASPPPPPPQPSPPAAAGAAAPVAPASETRSARVADAAAGAASAASEFTSARAEAARAEVVAATTYSEINEQGMDASKPPEFCARVGLDAFPPPMSADPPACGAADPSSPALFLRPSAGGAFLGTSPQAITASAALQTPPDPQSYQMMFMASLPYFPLPATNDSQYDGFFVFFAFFR